MQSPGRNVRAKSGLNKAILDQGWAHFVQMLEYKLEWLGGQLEKVDPKYTSQTCQAVATSRKKTAKRRQISPRVSCGFAENADVVGALNVLERGHRLLACGAEGLPTAMKQEPLENERLRA